MITQEVDFIQVNYYLFFVASFNIHVHVLEVMCCFL